MSQNVQHITMSSSGTDIVYIQLPGHPVKGKNEVAGCVKEMIRLDEVLKDRKLGAMINLDFDGDQNLIGIEVLL